LMLIVKNERSASWQLRFERAGKQTWMGLGSARLLTLTEARTRARAVRLQLLDGVDPLAAKRRCTRSTTTIAGRAPPNTSAGMQNK
jgi:Arm DNA-binding domain